MISMDSKCEHPRHEKILKKYMKSPVIEIKEDGTQKVIEPIIDKYVKTKHGLICLNCSAYEMGETIEKHPIYDSL